MPRYALERENKERWLRAADHVGRLVGITSVAAMCMIGTGAASSLTPESARYDPGVSLEEKPTPHDVTQESLSKFYDAKTGLTRDTGIDTQPCYDFKVCGTDLGQPFLLPDGSVGYLFGDTFAVAGPFINDEDIPETGDQYRAQAMLRSTMSPIKGEPIIFDSAPGLNGTGVAPETLGQWHILMNDAVSLPNGDIVISYQHTIELENPKDNAWSTDYASLAVSHDNGNSFELTGPIWSNDTENNLDPYQMWSMQRDGDYVYVVSVRTGRREGPMMLFRVRWDQMLEQDAYQYWNGAEWGERAAAQPLQTGHFGEPSLRKLSDGIWVMSYADYSSGPRIVTRTLVDQAQGPTGEWTDPKVQLSWRDLKNPYGGGIHPYSTADNLILMVSTWQTEGAAKKIQDRELVRYDVSHLVTTTE